MADSLVLLQTPASPFARKVRMVAHLRGVEISLEEARVHPVERNRMLAGLNPLAKIPVLLTPQGPLYDSRVICRYIHAQGSGPDLYAGAGVDPWSVLRLEALADGILDAAVIARYELTNRPEARRWTDWLAAQFARIEAALDALEINAAALDERHVGTITLAAALEYLDFRHPDLDWRTERPGLTRWLGREAETQWMQATRCPSP